MALNSDRIVVVETVYHQVVDEDAQSVVSKFMTGCKTNDHAYRRPIVISEDWQQVDTGWLRGHAGMLVIQNREGENLPHRPTEEQLAEVAGKIIEVGHSVGRDLESGVLAEWFIPPGESMRGRPRDVEFLFIRCCSGKARVTLFVTPE